MRPTTATVTDLLITDLGGRGDGIARLDGLPVYVPYALPGERVRVRLSPRRGGGFDGYVLERFEDAASRKPATCTHFERCGGCSLQHLEDGDYARWKLETLKIGLHRQGFTSPVFEPLTRTPPGSRRRARLAAVGRRGGLTLGFNAPNSHVVVDLEHCPVLTPRLVALLPPLRALLAEALRPGQRLDVAVLELAGTVDLGVIAPFTPTLSLRQRIAAFAREEDIARITWRRSDLEPPEPIIQQAPVRASFGGVAVDLPPGSFLQASAVGEAALTEFVTTWAEDGTTELFAGAGTFTLPLAAAGRQVRAYEGNGAMAAALGAAIRRAGLDGLARTEQRDLVRRPIDPSDFKESRCLLVNPPRTGAAEQIEGIARSRVRRLIYVSCNPVTFARDARRLAEAGFRLERIRPVDQFLWSPHLELAALLQR